MGAGMVTKDDSGITDLANAGIFGEYTYHSGDRFSLIAGLRGDWFYNHGFKVSPRVTLKYMPVDEIVIRANGGRGLRYSTPLVDNIGVFSTGKEFVGSYNDHILEDAWTFGGNITYYLPFGSSSNTYVSFDYFRTQFAQQMVVDYEYGLNQIHFYALDGGRSYTDNFQVDFSVDPVERFNITATFRYTDAKIDLRGQGLVEKPMTSRFKGVLNLQYATNLNKWIFDFTASLNGSCRVYNFMEDMYKNGRTPMYPLLYAQVTRRFKGWDVYIGAENLTNFRQKDVILGAVRDADGYVNAFQPSFDASCVWGPLMGFKAHAGFRFTLWKKG
jgi:outer membrane receptor protein involved in Fe transport